MEELQIAQTGDDGVIDAPVNAAEMTATIDRAQYFSDRGWFNEAIEMFERLINENADDPVLLLEYGNTLFKKGDMKNAGRVFTMLTELRPERIEGWNNLGIVQLNQNNIDEAFESFSRVLVTEPGNTGALLNLGNCHFGNGEYSAARECFEKACATQADLPDGWYNLGNACIELELFDEARHAFEKALRYRQEFPSALKNLGWVYEREGRLSDALQCYIDALATRKSDAALHSNLGNVYVKLQRYDDAKKSFLTAIRLAPHDIGGWMGLRGYALAKGDLETFVRATLAVLGRLSDDVLVKSIEILYDLQQTDHADEVLSQAQRIGRKGDMYDVLRLLLQQRKGNADEPDRVVLDRLLTIKKPSDAVCRGLARYFLDCKKYEETIRYVSFLEHPDGRAAGLRWRAMVALDKVNEARREMLADLSGNGASGDLYFLLADIEARRGNRLRARTLLVYALDYGFCHMQEIHENPVLHEIFESMTDAADQAQSRA